MLPYGLRPTYRFTLCSVALGHRFVRDEMNLTLITTTIAAAAGFALAWNLQAHQITKQELTHANERITIQRAARQTLERYQATLAEAQADSAKRNVRVRTDSDRAGDSGNGLRLTSTAAVRTATDDPAACSSIVAAYGSVVTESSEFIQAVAADADQCHSDLQLMQESWPK